MTRDELVEALKTATPAPTRIALVDEGGRKEWLVVTRGRGRWERLVDNVVAGRPWAELLLCDKRGATYAVLRPAAQDVADEQESDAIIKEAAASGDPTARFAFLLTDAVKTVTKSVSQAVENTVKTMRTESRQEMTAVLEAHQDMARDAFALSAKAASDLAVETDRRLALEAENAELRAQLGNQAAADPQQEAAQKREATILSLMTGGQGVAGGGGDGSQGMPQGQ